MTNTTISTLWMFLLPLIAILLPVWLSQRFGLYIRKTSGEFQDAPMSSAVGATLGLFAFMLAFTFQLVGNRFEKRKELFANEISNIRNTYLCAGFVPEPFRSKARKNLIDYVDLRIHLRQDLSKFTEIRSRSKQILDTLWNYSETVNNQDRSSEAYSLFASSVAELIRMFHERINIGHTHLHQTILNVLIFVAVFSMLTLGYQFGISGRISFLMTFLLGVTFAAVMWLIFALDHPEAGIIQISEQPLLELQAELHRQ